MFDVVLYEPEIPPNTGNIARQCVGMDAALHLVAPFAFDIDKKAVRRAGLDYWEHLDLTVHDGPEAFLAWLGSRAPWVVSKHGTIRYDQPPYRDGDVLLFGSETQGLPLEIRERWPGRSVVVPILGKVRSYNLANTVSVILAHASLKAGRYEGK